MTNDKEADICCNHPHESVVDRVRRKMADDETTQRLADFYKVFGEQTRIRILLALLESELCVCDLAELLNMNQSAISHQLRILKNSKLVRSRRDGKTVYYSFDDDHIQSIINQGMEHIAE